MEPVHEGDLGDIYVAVEDVVIGTQGIRLTRAKALLGYVLAQYIDGDNSEPTTSELVHILMLDALAKYLTPCPFLAVKLKKIPVLHINLSQSKIVCQHF